MRALPISISSAELNGFCRRHGIRRLSFFGSILRDDFEPESDIDVLVEFDPGVRIGLIGLAGAEIELSNLLGRKVDLNTPGFFGDELREQILRSAEVQYEAA